MTEHVIVASADFDYATDLRCDEQALTDACAELAAGAPVVADSAMVTAGIAGRPVICKSEETLTARLARTAGISGPAAAVRLAFGQAGPGAIWVVGQQPAALAEIMARNVQPSLIIGLPAGLAGAAEAKDAVRASGFAGADQRVGEGRGSHGGRDRVLRAGRGRPGQRASGCRYAR